MDHVFHRLSSLLSFPFNVDVDLLLGGLGAPGIYGPARLHMAFASDVRDRALGGWRFGRNPQL